MIREAADDGALSSVDIRHWIQAKYPGTNEGTINAQINYCTVNSESRVHGPENQKVRLEPHRLDLLYRTSRGMFERYDPARHGLWQIVKTDNGRFAIHRAGEFYGDGQLEVEQVPVQIGEQTVLLDGGCFAAETHLRDYLASNLSVIEPGLEPFVDEFGNGPVEFRTPVGNIDILGVDSNGDLLVVELKVDRSSDAVAGQILRYVNWVRRHLANDRKVRGLIIAKSISDRLLYAIDGDPTVEAREYEMNVTLRPPAASI